MPLSSPFKVNQSTVQENETGMWYWEPLADSFYYSDSYLAELGYADSEFPTSIKDWIKILHPDDIEKIRYVHTNHVSSANGGNQYEHPLRIRAKSGKYISVVVHGYILHRNAQQQATMISGFHIKKERIAAIDHEQQRMKFALQAAEDGIWDWDAQTNDVYYSPKYLEMVGYSREEFPGTADSWASRVHPDDYKTTVDLQFKIINSPDYGDSFECIYRFLHKNGSWIWVLGKGIVTSRDAEGKACRVTGVHIDINELQQSKEKLVRTLKKDTLTSVRSRYSFDKKLSSLTTADYPVSLIYVDADGLKIVNDLLGHTFGDEYLRKVSTMLAGGIRDSDSIYRVGGDEFAILLPNTGYKNANDTLRRLKNKVEEQNNINGSLFVSFGVATASYPAQLGTLTATADNHMYQNKRANQAQRHELIRQYCLEVLDTMNRENKKIS
ncbi:PAS domain-containing protein [Halodesulfovibrio aestuarii]